MNGNSMANCAVFLPIWLDFAVDRICYKDPPDHGATLAPDLRRYMTIDKVPDCIGVMKFERIKEGEEAESKEIDMED